MEHKVLFILIRTCGLQGSRNLKDKQQYSRLLLLIRLLGMLEVKLQDIHQQSSLYGRRKELELDVLVPQCTVEDAFRREPSACRRTAGKDEDRVSPVPGDARGRTPYCRARSGAQVIHEESTLVLF